MHTRKLLSYVRCSTDSRGFWWNATVTSRSPQNPLIRKSRHLHSTRRVRNVHARITSTDALPSPRPNPAAALFHLAQPFYRRFNCNVWFSYVFSWPDLHFNFYSIWGSGSRVTWEVQIFAPLQNVCKNSNQRCSLFSQRSSTFFCRRRFSMRPKNPSA